MGAIYSDEMGTKREQKEKRPLSFSVGLVVSFQAYRQLQLGNAPPSISGPFITLHIVSATVKFLFFVHLVTRAYLISALFSPRIVSTLLFIRITRIASPIPLCLWHDTKRQFNPLIDHAHVSKSTTACLLV